VFCGRPSISQGEGERAFPNWLNKIFPVEDGTELPEWRRYVVAPDAVVDHSWTAAEIASLTTKLVCNRCNTGWMARMEQRLEPILTSMITGHPTALSQVEQIDVAAWTTKTAIVLETMLSTEDHFPGASARLVMEQERPPFGVRVAAAAMEGELPPMGYRCARVHLTSDTAPPTDMHLYTIHIGTLVLTIIRFDETPSSYDGTVQTLAVPNDIEHPLFPPSTEFYWPPKVSLDLNGLGHLSRRGLEMPESWEPH
jgi:hypothetical protein